MVKRLSRKPEITSLYVSGMRRLLAVAALLVVALPAHGQAATNPVLDVGAPILEEEPNIPIHHAGVILVPWTYTFPNPGAAAAAFALGSTTISWVLGCAEGQVAIVGPSETTITFAAGTTDYSGTASLSIQATADTPGLRELSCRIEGSAGGTVQTLQSTDANDFLEVVAWNGNVVFASPPPRQAGPQKQIPYPIDITNEGNSQIQIQWEVIEAAGKWAILVPEPITLDAGQSVTTIATAVTPFSNGYNKDRESLQIRAIVTPVGGDERIATETIALGATVRGWYVPGPSIGFAVAALALAGSLTRRT